MPFTEKTDTGKEKSTSEQRIREHVNRHMRYEPWALKGRHQRLIMNFRLKDIYKNALLLTLIKLPQNILYAAVGVAIMYAVYSLSMSVPLAGILVVALLLFTLVSFTQIFMTNNIIKKYVLNPYLEQNPSEEQELPSPDFEDRISVDEI